MDSKETQEKKEQHGRMLYDLNAPAVMSPTSSTSQAMQHSSPLGALDDGSPSSSVAATQQPSMQVGIVKRRIGRPRKYADLSSASDANANPPAKRGRGRGSGSKKKLDALEGAGSSFTPHTINVNPGEDIAAKVLAFMSQEPRETCILSASGAISFGLIQVNPPRGALKCEGRYIIVNMSGSVLNTEINGTVNRAGTLRVSLAGPDGQVWGGVVSGKLVAASPVKVVVGSFLRREVNQNAGNVENNPDPASVSATESPQPRSSKSSEKNGSKSPLQQS